MILYGDLNYAHSRLVGTIVLYKNKPVMVNDMLGASVSIMYLKDGKKDTVMYDGNFDLTPVPLGYTNYDGQSLYLSRIPMRKDWKQGLRTTTTRCLMTGQTIAYEGQVPFSELHKAIVGEFPSLDKVIENVKTIHVNSMAFSRHFAIDKALYIWHKGRVKIGKIINPKTHEYSLMDNFFWARETLEEAL